MSFSYRIRRALSPLILPNDSYIVQEVQTPHPTVQDYINTLVFDQPKPNYSLDDSVIDEIAYRIMTNIYIYRPKREVEISPVTRMKINL